MTAFDPYGIQPDFAGQGTGVLTAWQRALNKLNLNKNMALQQYGFNAAGDLAGEGVMNSDGTFRSTNMGGGLNAVKDISDFASMDNKSGRGGFRNELTNEANLLDATDNGPDRGFTGGLANQAHAAAQRAVTSSQQQFTEGYNQFAGNFNIAGQQSQGEANAGLSGILADQANWGVQEAMWQSTIPTDTYTPGVSGGGSTPIGAKSVSSIINNAMASNPRAGQTFKNTGVTGQAKAQTFKGTSNPPASSRGGHAL